MVWFKAWSLLNQVNIREKYWIVTFTSSCIVLLFCRNHFIDVYCHMLTAALEFTLRRSREIFLKTLYAHACRVNQSGQWYCTWLNLIVLTWRIWRAHNSASKWQMGFNSAFEGLCTLKATSDRWTRQLTVNPLYSTWDLTLHYAESRSSSLWGNTSQDHLASPAVAVVPKYSPLSCV